MVTLLANIADLSEVEGSPVLSTVIIQRGGNTLSILDADAGKLLLSIEQADVQRLFSFIVSSFNFELDELRDLKRFQQENNELKELLKNKNLQTDILSDLMKVRGDK